MKQEDEQRKHKELLRKQKEDEFRKHEEDLQSKTARIQTMRPRLQHLVVLPKLLLQGCLDSGSRTQKKAKRGQTMVGCLV